jgi:hypothetical protein
VTKDEIIRMAREADLWGEIYAMQRFANLVATAEREEIAQILDKYDHDVKPSLIAMAIRARGNNDV